MVTKHSRFGEMCRDLRKANRLKLREVAAAIGVADSTAGNMESSQFKVISRDKALKLSNFYKLSASQMTEFMAAWEACPLSPHGEKRREYWKKANELRSKAKNHDPMKCGLVECLGIILMDRPDDQVCACDGTETCSVCYALARIGVTSPFTPSDREKILTQLTKLHEELLPKRVLPGRRPPPTEPAADEIFGG